MKSDLDNLMAERGFAALLVLGGSAHNPAMYYLANGASVGEGTLLVKPRGAEPVLFANSMERDEAARSGLKVMDLGGYNVLGLIRAEGGDELRARARLTGMALRDAGVAQGTVAVAGRGDVGAGYELITALSELHPQLNFVGEFGRTVLLRARATKDAAEMRRIRAVGRKTVRIVADTEAFLSSHRARKGYLVQPDGARLTVGDVKRFIRARLHANDLVDAENGLIFAIGRDAGVPHSRGSDRDPIALGQTIVYDIFPAEPGGGYYFDFTRTWCLGYAPPEVEHAYRDVLSTFRQVMRALQPGELCRSYQALTCDLLEARGHPTLRSHPGTTEGYVHSLAHGVGLDVHEAPTFGDHDGNPARLDPGVVVTIEPGVYYPERGFGVRIEDCVWLNPKTLKFETVASYHKRLVLPVRQ